MQQVRPTPFDLVFQSAVLTSFPAVRGALNQSRQDPRDRDAFLMLRDVVALLRELRPEEGLGEGIDQLAALVHHAYLFWDAGSLTVELTEDRLSELLSGPASSEQAESSQPPYYLQFPPRRIWAQVIPGQSHEPLDGLFQHSAPEPNVRRVLGVFGMHPERAGFSVVEVSGPRPTALTRPDGAPLFESALPAGGLAGLYSLVGEEELLELGWRAGEALPAGATTWRA